MKKNKYKIGGRIFEGTSLDKVFLPKTKIAKKDIIDYYVKIAPFMIPHTKGRAMNMMKAPDGIKGEIFYVQHRPKYFPNWIGSFKLKKVGGSVIHVVCDNLATPAYLAEEGFITFHIWNSLVKNLRNPDRLVFDLDPPEGLENFEKIRSAAFQIKEFFDSIGTKTFPMTTGSRGIHIIIPLDGKISFVKTRRFAKKVAEVLSSKYPGSLTSIASKKKRKGRVFVDYLRNSYGQTVVAPYAVRLKEGAPVAMPINWEDLENKKLNSQTYNIKNAFLKIKDIHTWSGFYRKKYNIDLLNKKID